MINFKLQCVDFAYLAVQYLERKKMGMIAWLYSGICTVCSVSQILVQCTVGNSNVSNIIQIRSVKMYMQAGCRARTGKEGHCTEHRRHHEHGRQGHQGAV